MSREEETIYQLIAVLLLFAVPVISFLVYVNSQTRKTHELAKQRKEQKYIDKYGKDAFSNLKLERSKNPVTLAQLTNTPRSGVFYSTAFPEVLIEFLLNNFPDASIGQAPHRLTDILPKSLTEFTISAQWPCPQDAKITTKITLDLKAIPVSDGRTALKYKYSVAPENDPFALQLITITNQFLESAASEAS